MYSNFKIVILIIILSIFKYSYKSQTSAQFYFPENPKPYIQIYHKREESLLDQISIRIEKSKMGREISIKMKFTPRSWN